jgi:EAL domain-containing protein (putative c-di-GMP-specific phosphodiesterase class I)
VRVNLSARQLDDAGLADEVRRVLAETGLPPERLCLEITETALMADAEASRELLESLDRLGVSLAVDDFGTGYSSLSYLKQFPVDVLKIDRSFVDGLPGDAEDSAIVSTIVRLAESLAMDVTAEGIETFEQAETLTAMGCTKGQGFLYARPMPVDEFRRVLGVA